MDGLVRGILRLAARLAPEEERDRWLEEWEGEMETARRRGLTGPRRIAWAFGLLVSAFEFRRENGMMEGWGKEIRYAVRGLARSPGFTVVAVLTLALGIGANTAIFSVVNGVVLRPLDYPEPDELVMVATGFPTMGFDRFWVSPPEYIELQERARSFQALGAFRQVERSIGGGDRPERVTAAIASAELFDVLGVPPLLGRGYSREEDVPEGPDVVVLSHALWQRTFGGDPDIVGRSIEVNGQSSTVLGVMPPGFDLEDGGIEAWLPLSLDRADRSNRGSHYLYLVGRLNEGTTVEGAAGELRGLVSGWQEATAGAGHVPRPDLHPMHLTSLQDEVVGEVRKALWLLLGAVAFVLLIACANVANLLLARAEARQREVAVRVAMGAGRGRLLRQFLTEGVVLSVLGGALGVAIAWLSLEMIRAVGPGSLPRLREVGIDGVVFLFTAGVALFTGILFGLAPLRHIGAGVASFLREGGQRMTGGTGRSRTRGFLVISEMALALILVVGSGLMIRSFTALTAVDPGFDARDVLTFELYLPPGSYPSGEEVIAFHDALAGDLEALPGVEGAAAMSGLPPIRDLNANDTQFEGMERTSDGPPHNVDFYQTVTHDYVETMGIEVIRGRDFEPADGPDAAPVALVNESLARLFYPGEDPVGRRLRPCCGDDVPWLEIVGVVGDVKQAGLDQPAGTELYFHAPQAAALGSIPRTMNVVVRTAGRPTTLAAPARETVWRHDRSLPVAGLRTMDEVLAGSNERPRFLALLLTLFAGLALALAAVGTYGVMAYSVAQRSREMGIRMALGAERGSVQALVLREGLGLALLGLLLGVGGAWALTGVMESLLFDVAPRDPATFLLAPAFLGVVALAACWIPARRATGVDPSEVIRAD